MGQEEYFYHGRGWLWYNKGGLLYDQFDYTKMFFRRDKTTPLTQMATTEDMISIDSLEYGA